MLRGIWIGGTLLLGLELGFSGAANAQTPDSARADSTAALPKKLNPYTGNPEQTAEGRKLYLKWNCYGCHGTQGGGGIGKPLNDTDWAYGGDDAAVFETILEGRSGGMPKFGELV
ncbi:MAG: c-type cytochrome, partial [Gemmatimonadetes bacterium]|nr:c-type cytochrome [Gemmatimonadota bacterium]